MTHFLAPLLRARDTRRATLVSLRTGAVLATAVETAFDSASRRRGLLGRDALANGEALIIAPCQAVHTWRMRFAIDVVCAARDGRVVKIRHAVPARRVTGAWRAFAVIELPAGVAAAHDLGTGDRLAIVTPDAQAGNASV